MKITTKFPQALGLRYAIGTALQEWARKSSSQTSKKTQQATMLLNEVDPVDASPLGHVLNQIVWVLQTMSKVARKRLETCDGFASQLTGTGEELVSVTAFEALVEFEACSTGFGICHTHLGELVSEAESMLNDEDMQQRLQLLIQWD